MTALAEFERLWIVLEGSRRAPISAVATPIQPLAVSRAEAGRLLSRKRTAVWRLIKKGLLDLTADDQVTMESIRRCAAARKAS